MPEWIQQPPSCFGWEKVFYSSLNWIDNSCVTVTKNYMCASIWENNPWMWTGFKTCSTRCSEVLICVEEKYSAISQAWKFIFWELKEKKIREGKKKGPTRIYWDILVSLVFNCQNLSVWISSMLCILSPAASAWTLTMGYRNTRAYQGACKASNNLKVWNFLYLLD